MSSSGTSCEGSILFVLFASIGMVGIIGVAAMNLMRGPVRAMADITRHTIAENQMIASGKLALVMSAKTSGDCDHDGIIEPIGWTDKGPLPAPQNGGLLPRTIGAALTDPWGQAYGYCAWDHGSLTASSSCGPGAGRLPGAAAPEYEVLAVISAGPNGQFETGCRAAGTGSNVVRMPGSDDIVLAYDFAQALAESGGLWSLDADDAGTATIAKNLSVTDDVGTRQLSFDAATGALALAGGGTGSMPNIKTDYIQNLTSGVPIEVLSNIKLGGDIDLSGDVAADGQITAGTATISTGEESAIAAIVTASGDDGVGLKASGTSKAIEAEGIIDMMGHRITKLAEPVQAEDAATKNYVDDKFVGVSVIRQKCDSFMPTSCSSGASQNLAKTSLGACKAACEAAGVQCCEAAFPLFSNNPNAALNACRGYAAPSQPGTITGIIGGLFGTIAAFCYQQ